MSGIAGLLLALGHRVSGSDKVDTVEVGRLEKKGLRFHIPHRADEVMEADLIVYSSAIKAGNVAYDEARKLGLPMVRRADALAAIMNSKKGHRDLRHARQDDHVFHGRPRASKLRPQTLALRGRGDPHPRNECALGLRGGIFCRRRRRERRNTNQLSPRTRHRAQHRA